MAIVAGDVPRPRARIAICLRSRWCFVYFKLESTPRFYSAVTEGHRQDCPAFQRALDPEL